MAIKHPLYIASLASIIFIGPHSEALFTNIAYADLDHSGYHCQSGYQQKKVTIDYQQSIDNVSSCRVSWQHNQGEEKILWDNLRNTSTCENNAAAIALRLQDRGWQCQTMGM